MVVQKWYSFNRNCTLNFDLFQPRFGIVWAIYAAWYAGKHLTTSIPKHTNENKKMFLPVSTVQVLLPWLISRCPCDGSEHRGGKNVMIDLHELELASSSTALSVQAEFPPRGVWTGKAVQNVSTRTVMKVVIVCLTLGFSKSSLKWHSFFFN